MFLYLIPASFRGLDHRSLDHRSDVRPAKTCSQAVWACLGAGLLLTFQLVPLSEALGAIVKGYDVYFFLTGMMLLAELARREGVFDWLAVVTVRAARGSQLRLFTLVYALGIAVTTLLSNDATAIVLTPAIYAVDEKSARQPFAVLVCVRSHRKRGQLCPSNFESGQSGCLWQQSAAATSLVANFSVSLRRVNSRDLPDIRLPVSNKPARHLAGRSRGPAFLPRPVSSPCLALSRRLACFCSVRL